MITLTMVVVDLNRNRASTLAVYIMYEQYAYGVVQIFVTCSKRCQHGSNRVTVTGTCAHRRSISNGMESTLCANQQHRTVEKYVLFCQRHVRDTINCIIRGCVPTSDKRFAVTVSGGGGPTPCSESFKKYSCR